MLQEELQMLFFIISASPAAVPWNGTDMKKNRKELAVALGNLTQLGINVAVSFLLWILLALWLKKTFSLGNYVTVIGIILGAGSAGLSFYKFCKDVINVSKEEDNDEN